MLMPTVSTQEAAFTGIILFYVAFTDVFNYHKVVDGVFADCSIVAVEVDRIVIFFTLINNIHGDFMIYVIIVVFFANVSPVVAVCCPCKARFVSMSSSGRRRGWRRRRRRGLEMVFRRGGVKLRWSNVIGCAKICAH